MGYLGDCKKKVIRHGKDDECAGHIIRIMTKLRGRVEVDYICDHCGLSPDLSPLVIEDQPRQGTEVSHP